MVKTQSYVITETETTIISEKSRAMGDSSDSAALRAIIREWKEMTEQENARRNLQSVQTAVVTDAQTAA
jgi:hypothetical protein